MAERSQHGVSVDSNPITESRVALGVLSKQSNSTNHHSNGQPPIINHPEPMIAGHQGLLVMGGDHGDGHLIVVDGGSSSSPSPSEEESSEGESEYSSQEEDGELTEEMQLKNAGVEIDLEALGAPSEGGVAPLQLLSEVNSAC